MICLLARQVCSDRVELAREQFKWGDTEVRKSAGWHCAISWTDMLLTAPASMILKVQHKVAATPSRPSTHPLMQIASTNGRESLQPSSHWSKLSSNSQTQSLSTAACRLLVMLLGDEPQLKCLSSQLCTWILMPNKCLCMSYDLWSKVTDLLTKQTADSWHCQHLLCKVATMSSLLEVKQLTYLHMTEQPVQSISRQSAIWVDTTLIEESFLASANIQLLCHPYKIDKALTFFRSYWIGNVLHQCWVHDHVNMPVVQQVSLHFKWCNSVCWYHITRLVPQNTKLNSKMRNTIAATDAPYCGSPLQHNTELSLTNNPKHHWDQERLKTASVLHAQNYICKACQQTYCCK